LFLTYGRQRRTRTIHRAVWAPGVENREAALNYSNELVRLALVEQASRHGAAGLRIADLGCGVGGSLCYLGEHISGDFWGVGLTISSTQAHMADRYARMRRMGGRCAFLAADYLHIPLVHGLDAAFSIEALAHAQDPQRYFGEASRLLRAGGRLMLCDDFRGEKARLGDFWLDAFQCGWHAAGVLSLSQVIDLARGCGLQVVEQRDLTPQLRLSRLPTWLARRLVSAGLRGSHPYWQSLAGGMALQQALKTGIVTYQFVVFEKLA
jgi:cyclopropane fatty-acyl-phospholipid synthase-like methyltransferase